MYAKCGSLYPAKQALEKLQGRDIFTWTALLAGYTEYGRDEELLECLKQIQAEGIPPNTVTFICSAKACTRVRDLNRGLELHCQIGRSGLLGKELALSNALVDMYIKCGFLAAAHEVFHTIRDKDVVSWSTLIVGCLDHGHNEEALIFLDKMLLQGILPSTVTIVSALTACGNLGAISKGHMLHAQIRNKACYVKDLVLGTTLVNMYAKCGSLIVAQRVFDDLQVQDAVLWTALIEGYADAGQGEMALTFYDKMQFEGVLPDAFTYICSLKACITVGAVEKGQELHAEIERLGLLDHHLFVGNIVVDMYAKCGRLLLAQQVFNRLPAREVDSWNPLLTGYALAGRHAVVFSIFECMMREHIRPDSVTFLVVLNACSTAGLCSRGHTYFEAMCNDFGIAPDFKHCLSLIDSFYRVGNFNGGAKVVEGVRPPSDDILQRIILSACKSCGCA
ncbi:hypothetical protein KP509_30G071500 [Ceratopteris richardii]|nr:hypothetical protein KP509_30G071500 [Ceratopteris richardii]